MEVATQAGWVQVGGGDPVGDAVGEAVGEPVGVVPPRLRLTARL